MDAVMTWLDMEGAGFYIWPPYLLALVLMLGIWIGSRWSMRRREQELQRLQNQRRAPEKAEVAS